MNKKHLISISYLVLFSSFVFGDGSFFRSVYYYEDIYEPTQKAIILYDGSFEQLIIQAGYKGSMNDFAWIIPVPAYPEINKSNAFLFEELHYLTKPDYKSVPNFLFGSFGTASKMADTMQSVTVLEQKQVGIYEVTLLSSDEPKELIKWLNDNKYSVPQEAESVLDFYIQKKWFFVAMRINLAPYDVNLIDTLRKIEPTISNQENALATLTKKIMYTIKEKKEYSELGIMTDLILEYGSDNEEELEIYRGNTAPTKVMDKDAYYAIFENYNGYKEEHFKNEIGNFFSINEEEKISAPEYYMCTNNQQYPNCDIWQVKKSSPEYLVLKDSECGKYCSAISSDREYFLITDLANAGANAVIKGDSKIIDFFKVSTEKKNWYDNQADLFNDYKNQIENWLRINNEYKKYEKQEQLKAYLEKDFSAKAGEQISYSEIPNYLNSVAITDFKNDANYYDSKSSGLGFLTQQTYDKFKSKFLGHQNDAILKSDVEKVVKNVVYWKQENEQKKLGQGTVQPIYLKFPTKEIIYPLKISSINKGTSEVLIYVFAKYKTEIPSFNTEYAKWIDTKDINTEYYRSYSDSLMKNEIMPHWYPQTYYYLNQILDDRYFLTKFRKEMWPKEMSDDLVIKNAGNNREYKMVTYEDGYITAWIFSIIFSSIPFSLLFSLFMIIRIINNKKFSQESIWHLSMIRTFIYALIVMACIFILTLAPRISDFFITIFRPIGDVFEFLGHVLNYIGLPEFIQIILGFAVCVIFIFCTIHLLGTGILSISRQVGKKK